MEQDGIAVIANIIDNVINEFRNSDNDINATYLKEAETHRNYTSECIQAALSPNSSEDFKKYALDKGERAYLREVNVHREQRNYCLLKKHTDSSLDWNKIISAIGRACIVGILSNPYYVQGLFKKIGKSLLITG
jgi:hypothetical protein